jgi:hypothetical protein
MIAKEIQFRFEHYALLLIMLSGFIAAFLLAGTQSLRMTLSLFLGVVYVLWGLWSHRSELLTVRLVLEYVSVAALGCGMLIILTRTL